ncbi:MAG: DUF929 family protein [Candidatus Parvarchaeota archaeon]|jgi:hypothetical protein|nr:DUF929 family protein [Candidatus Parvarchaeota archaeon]
MPDEDKEPNVNGVENENVPKELHPEKAVAAEKSSENAANPQQNIQNKTEEKKAELTSNPNDDELEKLRKENERLKELQRLREENAKLSTDYAAPSGLQRSKSDKNRVILPLIVGVVAVAIIVIALIFVLHAPSKSTAVAFGGKVVFTSANLSGVSNSNLGNTPIPNSLVSPNFSAINNSATSFQFFKGPIGQSEPSYANALSNLSAQLEGVGQSQLSGNIECVPAGNSSNGPNPAYCVLLIGSNNYDIIPITVGGNSTVKVNGSSEFKLPLLTYNGKPTFVYIGAQGCPFCAGMRWAIIIALSRFGNFSNLFYDKSATNDGNVPTFTFDYNAALFYGAVSKPSSNGGPYGDSNPTPFFVGAYYNSSYINFIPLDETGSSFLVNVTGIADVSPFVFNNVVLASQAFLSYHGFGIYNFLAGGVPIFDINNQYVFDGASINAGTYISSSGLNPAYSTHQDMLNSIENPASGSFGQTVLGAANILTAQICETLNNTAPVCSLSYISGLENKLNTVKI